MIAASPRAPHAATCGSFINPHDNQVRTRTD
jgi:hypothetical protein